MDNRIFNVNGRGYKQFLAALKLAFMQEDDTTRDSDALPDASGYLFIPDKGLVVGSYMDKTIPGFNLFLTPMTAEECGPMLFKWLSSPQAKGMPFKDWDDDCDHDGSNSEGWRMFVEDWGKVSGLYGVIVCIRPAYMWHGK